VSLPSLVASLREQLATGADLSTTVDDASIPGPLSLYVAQGRTTWSVEVVAHDRRVLFDEEVEPAAFVSNLPAFIGYCVRLAAGTAERVGSR
jgi:hypothetical protein